MPAPPPVKSVNISNDTEVPLSSKRKSPCKDPPGNLNQEMGPEVKRPKVIKKFEKRII